MESSDLFPIVSVFVPSDGTGGGRGGNKTTVGIDAGQLSDAEMQSIAHRMGHESGFVRPPPDASFDFAFRFFVPKHETEMCGHATVGALWVLRRLGRWPAGRDRVAVWTKSGRVNGRLVDPGTPAEGVAISQPKGHVSPLPDPAAQTGRIASVLGITEADLAPVPIRNAATSRVKTLIQLKSPDAVNALKPDFTRMESLCEEIGSTGLYPYAIVDREQRVFEARQFPKSAGYPEDPATGIAATALTCALAEQGLIPLDERPIRILQGRAMGQPSELRVSLQISDGRVSGCWLTGLVSKD